jgi:D-alanyl-lipoteichoic acid acyltransferase DltB (MBOAT superfamily)
MLFNSYLFLGLFLPLTLLAHRAARRMGARPRTGLLLAASLIFYAAWDVVHLALLAASILTNFLIGRQLEAAERAGRGRAADLWLIAGLVANLGALGWFKYARFIAENLGLPTGGPEGLAAILLPLGISFFTFEQIGYLVDLRRGRRYGADLLSYALFVSFFPRLVAGPVLRYDEIVPQLAGQAPRRGAADPWQLQDLGIGLAIFSIGLVKKTVLADGIAPYANPAFNLADAGGAPDFFAAWGGALAYACQLYFDFSGYSDMAIGAARCFGIRFPANFASPYKARNIIDFWRRWHITLSRFLRDYLYVALGGNRRGPVRRYANLIVTMLLGGFWHGANWTFVVWGGLHALYLCVNHAWIGLCERLPVLARLRRLPGYALAGWALTFLCVVVAWVFFRATTLSGALAMLSGMAGLNGAEIPSALAPAIPAALHPVLAGLGIGFGGASGSAFVLGWAWVIALLAIAFLAPNSQQIMARAEPTLDNPAGLSPARLLAWRPSPGWAFALGVVLFLGLASVANRNSEFLYWQF